ncbi:hypothetical protein [Sulfobacillus thermosulfidooxidans]|uniref:hypothetical protein n=1 Tax=Sulfobacillus thermosulfidooxidans TaxID=28034 RepID=UPI0006B5BC89|nr:hypothetical protein [Sulfobacillus thermosulfidooxidans]
MMDQTTVKKILISLKPEQMQHYLKMKGWTRSQTFDRAELWTHAQHDAEILLPRDQHVADYLLRMADAVEVLRKIENRSFIDVLSALHKNTIFPPR